LSRGAQLLGLCVLPSVVGRVSDPMSGYFLVRRSAIAGAALSPLGYKILIEVIGRGDRPHRRGRVRVSRADRGQEQGHLEGLCRVPVAPAPSPHGVLPARFLKFAAVGLSGVALDMLILWLLKAAWDGR